MRSALALMTVGVGLAVTSVALATPLLFTTADCTQKASNRRTGSHDHWVPFNPGCNTTVCDAGAGGCARVSSFVPDPNQGNNPNPTGDVTIFCHCDNESPFTPPGRCGLTLKGRAQAGTPLGPLDGDCAGECPEFGQDCEPEVTGDPSPEPGAGWVVVRCICE